MSQSTPLPLTGRTALVTGASAGIGVELAREFGDRLAEAQLHEQRANVRHKKLT